jgi:hypothetical protein
MDYESRLELWLFKDDAWAQDNVAASRVYRTDALEKSSLWVFLRSIVLLFQVQNIKYSITSTS